MSIVGEGKADWSIAKNPTITKPDTTGLTQKDAGDTAKLLNGGIDSSKSIVTPKTENKIDIKSGLDKKELKNELPSGLFDKFSQGSSDESFKIRKLMVKLSDSGATGGEISDAIGKLQKPLDTDSLITRLSTSANSVGTRLVIGTEINGATTKQLKEALKGLEDKIVAGGPGSKEAKTLVDMIEKELSSRKKDDPSYSVITEPIAPAPEKKPLDVGSMVSRLSQANWGSSKESIESARSSIKETLQDAPSWQIKDAIKGLKDKLESGFAKHEVAGIREAIDLLKAELSSRKAERTGSSLSIPSIDLGEYFAKPKKPEAQLEDALKLMPKSGL